MYATPKTLKNVFDSAARSFMLVEHMNVISRQPCALLRTAEIFAALVNLAQATTSRVVIMERVVRSTNMIREAAANFTILVTSSKFKSEA